jgi:hypothetical protein
VTGVVVEQSCEDRGAVEAGKTQPVDGATGGDQRRGSTVGEQCVLVQGYVAHLASDLINGSGWAGRFVAAV